MASTALVSTDQDLPEIPIAYVNSSYLEERTENIRSRGTPWDVSV
jgi:hypothetical protein